MRGARSLDGAISTTVVTGKYVQTLWQTFRDHYFQTVKLYDDGTGLPLTFDFAGVHLQYFIGPLDTGRELVARFTTNIHTYAPLRVCPGRRERVRGAGAGGGALDH